MALPVEHFPISEPSGGESRPHIKETVGSEEPFFNSGSSPDAIVLNVDIVSEKRHAMETLFNVFDATRHLLYVATEGRRSIPYIQDVVTDASRRIEEGAIDDLLELYDTFAEHPTGELLLELVDYLGDEKYVTGDNIIKLRRLVLVSGSILLIEHSEDTT